MRGTLLIPSITYIFYLISKRKISVMLIGARCLVMVIKAGSVLLISEMKLLRLSGI